MNRNWLLVAALLIGVVHFGPRYLPLPSAISGPVKVLVIHEAQEAARLPTAQQEILFDGRLSSHIQSNGGQYRCIDKDARDVPKEWEPLWNRDKSKLPKWVVARGNRIVKDEPLPASVEAAIAVVK